jgi:hypothetical protein
MRYVWFHSYLFKLDASYIIYISSARNAGEVRWVISNGTTEISLYKINVGNVGDAEVEGEFLFGCVMNLFLFHMMVLLPFYLFGDYEFWSLFKISDKIFWCLFNTFHKSF